MMMVIIKLNQYDHGANVLIIFVYLKIIVFLGLHFKKINQ